MRWSRLAARLAWRNFEETGDFEHFSASLASRIDDFVRSVG